MSSDAPSPASKPKPHPFRRAVIRGFGVVLPPLMTIVIFLWIGSTINHYVLRPAKWMAREALVWVNNETVSVAPGEPAPAGMTALPIKDERADRQFVPDKVFKTTSENLGDQRMPYAGDAVYRIYTEAKYLQPTVVIPVFTCLFILVLYVLGKTMAAGLGRLAVETGERGIQRIPVIRNVYASVKQVTDFVFSQHSVEYTRVIAVEYPRRGIWSLGMVTGESLGDIRSAANEPLLSVLIPTSPAPFTGFTVTIKKSEAIDLNLTIDQAFQFIVSCGVVVPPHQVYPDSTDALPSPTDSTDGDTKLPAATSS